MALTKIHIVNSISNQIGYPKKRSSEMIEIILETIKKALESGDDVLVSGFGKFCVKEKKARRGRNPGTGESIMLKPRKIAKFKWSGRLRKKING